jgi:hypothetical protein
MFRQWLVITGLGSVLVGLLAGSAGAVGITFSDSFDAYDIDGDPLTFDPDQDAFEAVWLPLPLANSYQVRHDQKWGTNRRSEPYSVFRGKDAYANQRSLVDVIEAADPNADVVNGSDTPGEELVLTYWVDFKQSVVLGHALADCYVELTDGVDHATLPGEDATPRNAIAIGTFPSWLGAATYRVMFFDGQSWYEAGGIAPGFGDDVRQWQRWNQMRLTVRETMMDVEVYSKYSGEFLWYSRFEIPRQYTGGFRAIALGPAYVPVMDTRPSYTDDVELNGGVVGQAPSACNTPPQDVDGNGHVDLTDYGTFLTCYNGPERPYGGAGVPGLEEQCACLDSDADGDLDLTDYGVFLGCYNGPGNPPACP